MECCSLELAESSPRSEGKKRHANSNQRGGKHRPPLHTGLINDDCFAVCFWLELNVPWVEVALAVIALDVQFRKKLVEGALS